MNNDETNPLGWWVISGEALKYLLRRAYDGEDPDMIYIETYANSNVEKINGD